MPEEPGYSMPRPMVRDLQEIKKIVLGGSVSRSRRFKRRRGGGDDGGTENVTAYAVCTQACQPSTYAGGGGGIVPNGVGKCVLLDAEGAATASPPLEFKNRQRTIIRVNDIIELDSADAIEPGTTWDGSGETEIARVWGKHADVKQYLETFTGWLPGASQALTHIAGDWRWVTDVIADVDVDAVNKTLRKQPIGGVLTVYHAGGQC